MNKYEKLVHRFTDHENRFWSLFEEIYDENGEEIPTIAFADIHEESKCPHVDENGNVCGCAGTPVFEQPAVEIDNDGVAEILNAKFKVKIWDLVVGDSMVISKNTN
tara:strand:- start:547 stop:864 length:318 start_codon:yes stop_codon:yes gene_type:complete